MATVRHLWLAAGHSLCELEEGGPAEELREVLEVHAPVCGACLLLAGRLRRQAAAFLELSQGEVVPTSAREAWRLLEQTPWAARLDLSSFFRDHPDIDDHTDFAALRYAIDPELVRDLVQEIQALRARSAEQTHRR